MSGVKQVTTGEMHACALLNNGKVYCWGNNQFGSLEDGLFNYSNQPVLIKGITNAISISAGNTATCALNTSGKPYCWGEEDSWGESVFNKKFLPRPDSFSNRKDIAKLDISSTYNGAILSSSGELEMWGWNRFGVLGRQPFQGLSAYPLKVDLPAITDFIVSTWGLNCAILKHSKETYCWGSPSYNLQNIKLPFKIPQWDNASQLSFSEFNVCALANDTVSCLGITPENTFGTLATSTPAAVLGLPAKMKSIFSTRKGYGGHCGFSEEGKVFCWGYYQNTNFPHFVSTKFPENPLYALEVFNPFETPITFMGTGDNLTCIGEKNGNFRCIGRLIGFKPDFRDGVMRTTTYHNVPNPSKLSVGIEHACVLKKDGSVWCWGHNLAGQIGNGSDDSVESPVKINYPETIVDIDLQNRCTLAKGASGIWYTSGNCRRPL